VNECEESKIMGQLTRLSFLSFWCNIKIYVSVERSFNRPFEGLFSGIVRLAEVPLANLSLDKVADVLGGIVYLQKVTL